MNLTEYQKYQETQAAQAKQLGTLALRKAAEEAGEAYYAVPLCGGGFTNHHRITSTGRCLECSQSREKRSRQRMAAFRAAGQSI